MRPYSGILTAAGYSSRMGSLNALLPWKGTTLIRHQVSALKDGGCSEGVVVVGYRSQDIRSELSDQEVVYAENPNYQSGRVSSIKAGINASSTKSRGFVLLGVDQPRTISIVSELLRTHIEHDSLLTSPRYEGRGGHPVIFSSRLRDEILYISEKNRGLREVFDRHRPDMNKVISSDPIVRLDLNTYQQYEQAREFYGT